MESQLNSFKAENLLFQYRTKLQRVYKRVGFLGEGTKELEQINQDLEQLLAQASLLNIINDKHVIAISGFQGSGKSTLLKWFLFNTSELSPWFPQNVGVGENLPILITLDEELTEVEGVLYSLDKRSDSEVMLAQKSISAKESKERSNKPKNEDVYIELFVPMPEFDVSKEWLNGYSFLLLPGIEDFVGEDDIKAYRQEHMKAALTACSNTLLVLDPEGYPSQANQEALSYIQKVYTDTNILFALTKADLAEDVNKGFVERVKKDFGIEEDDRVLSTGATKSLSAVWRPKLRDMLLKYGGEQSGLRSSQRSALKKMLKKGDRTRRKIKRILKEVDLRESDKVLRIKDYLESYDNAVSKIKTRFLDEAKNEIISIANNAFEEVDDKYKNDEWYERFGEWVDQKLNGPSSIKEIKKIGEDAWHNEIEERGGKRAVKLKIMNRTMNRLSVYKELPENSNNFKQLQKSSLSNEFGREGKLDKGIVNNYRYFNEVDQIPSEELDGKNFGQAMRKLPYILFESSRLLLTINPEKVNYSDFEPTTDIDNEKIKQELKDYVDQFSSDTRGIALGALGVLGADFIPDGDFDTINGVRAMFGNEEAAAQAGIIAGDPILGGAIIAVAALTIAHSINQAAIAMNLAKIRDAGLVINNIKDEVIRNFKKEFDNNMVIMREFIESKIKKKMGVGVDYGRYLNLEGSLYQLKETRTELRELLRDEAHAH